MTSPLRLLYAAQAVAAVGMAAGGAAGGLLAAEITGDPSTVVLPLGAVVLGATLAVPPVSLAMRRFGRRSGLLLGLLLAVLGAVVVLGGAAARLLLPVLAGHLLLGAGNTAVMFGRYVAVSLVERPGPSPGRAAPEHPPGRDPATARRGAQAVAAALTAAAVGAVLGPNLLDPAGIPARSADLPTSAGLYLIAVPAFALAALLILRLPADRPEPAGPGPRRCVPGDAAGPARPGTPPRRSDGLPVTAPVLLGAANAIMVTMMAVLPNELHHHGWRLPSVGLVVSLHVAAMFGLSPLSGWLYARFPLHRVAAAGTVLAAASALTTGVLADRPGSAGTVAVLLVVLGGAWNVQLVGGTMWLITRLPPERRQRGEAIGEVVMGAAATAGTFAAAPLLASAGPAALGLSAAALGLAVAALVLIRGREPVLDGSTLGQRDEEPVR
jgi:MFS family permease